ncbi:MAG: protein-glutamate methylesterase/protein-glutamine glutaminase, partial [Steroidobacteraceae bacterium]
MIPTTHPRGAPAAKRPIRVLIVDDSALVRSLLSDILKAAAGIEVVGVAADAHAAREKIKQLNPDVLTLDVEMPKMDGITFLRNLMRLRPMPVVMVSSLTERGADVTLDALALGAVDYLSKPKIDLAATLKDYADELIEKIRIAARASVRALDPRQSRPHDSPRPAHSADAVLLKSSRPGRPLRTTDRVIAIGASTGGTEAIKEVLMRLPPDCPGVVIAQHIPKAFSAPFARRMNDCCPVSVCEAQDGQHLLPGHAYIAPGDRHLMLVRDGARYVCRLDDGVPVNRHKPSVDVLFRSVAQNAGRNAIGVLLTGMGRDGSQ